MRKSKLKAEIARQRATIARLNLEIGKLRDERSNDDINYSIAQKTIDLLRAEVSELREKAKPNNRPKLTMADANKIRWWVQSHGASQKWVAQLFEVNPATVSRIVRGQYHAGKPVGS